MLRVQKGENVLRQYGIAIRKVSTAKVRVPWRHRSIQRLKKTPAEAAALKTRRAEHRKTYAEALAAAQQVIMDQAVMLKETFGRHSVNYYYEEIMQHSRLASHSRKATRWNAFLKQEVQKVNSARAPGEKLKSSELAGEISKRWKAMSPEEQEATTVDAVKSLEDFREMKEYGSHNVMLNAFADAQKTLIRVDRELVSLNTRTGVEFILVGVRPDTTHWNQPHVFYTSRASDFFEYCFKTSISSIAFRFDGFCIAGIQGVAKTHLDEVLDLKKKLSERILHELQAAAAPAQVNRMFYTNFDTNITAKYRVVLENWPLTQFMSPGDISSRNELRVLYRAWESGSTRFRKLTEDEFKRWDMTRSSTALNGSQTENPTVASSSSAPNPTNSEEPPALSLSSPTGPSSSGSPSTSNHPPVPSHPPAPPSIQSNTNKRPHDSLNVVFSVSGMDMPVVKKPRKERSDKGVKRGPRKNQGAQQPSAMEGA